VLALVYQTGRIIFTKICNNSLLVTKVQTQRKLNFLNIFLLSCAYLEILEVTTTTKQKQTGFICDTHGIESYSSILLKRNLVLYSELERKSW
jgi:hypothetical protein